MFLFMFGVWRGVGWMQSLNRCGKYGILPPFNDEQDAVKGNNH